jgi:hypothetical protein
VPGYYLNLRSRDGPEGLAVDLEGDEVAGPEALLEHVHGTARDLIRHTRLSSIPDWLACSFEVTDEAGQPVLTFPFRTPKLRPVLRSSPSGRRIDHLWGPRPAAEAD